MIRASAVVNCHWITKPFSFLCPSHAATSRRNAPRVPIRRSRLGWNRKLIYRFGVSPNKLFDYMMAGRPVIHAIEAPGDLVAESGCGLSIPPETRRPCRRDPAA